MRVLHARMLTLRAARACVTSDARRYSGRGVHCAATWLLRSRGARPNRPCGSGGVRSARSGGGFGGRRCRRRPRPRRRHGAGARCGGRARPRPARPRRRRAFCALFALIRSRLIAADCSRALPYDAGHAGPDGSSGVFGRAARRMGLWPRAAGPRGGQHRHRAAVPGESARVMCARCDVAGADAAACCAATAAAGAGRGAAQERGAGGRGAAARGARYWHGHAAAAAARRQGRPGRGGLRDDAR